MNKPKVTVCKTHFSFVGMKDFSTTFSYLAVQHPTAQLCRFPFFNKKKNHVKTFLRKRRQVRGLHELHDLRVMIINQIHFTNLEFPVVWRYKNFIQKNCMSLFKTYSRPLRGESFIQGYKFQTPFAVQILLLLFRSKYITIIRLYT